MKIKRFANSNFNRVANLLREAKIKSVSDRGESLDLVIDAFEQLLVALDEDSVTTELVANSKVDRWREIGENVKLIGMTNVYKYNHEDGATFSHESRRIDDCRRLKDEWIENGYSPISNRHISIYYRKSYARSKFKAEEGYCLVPAFGGYAALKQDEVDYFRERGVIKKM